MKNRRSIKRSKKGNIKIKSILRLFVIFFVIGAVFFNIVSAKGEKMTQEYIVEQNDTLWKIAANICKKADKDDLSIQKVVFEIKELNNIKSSDIFVGQELVIPIY